MKGKPVITATQMLDSMQRNPTPTRAEVSDNAMIEFAVQRGRELGCLQDGDVVVVTTGIDRTTGSTDTIRVITLD